MAEHEIKNSARCWVLQDGVYRKIFKILFQKSKPEFYIAFPYFSATEYQIGTLVIPAGVEKLPSFNSRQNRTASSILPVKFSYHQDRKIHFKPTSPSAALVNVGFKHDRVQGTPMAELQGEHIFTILFEGLAAFAVFDPDHDKKKNTVNFLIQATPNIKTFKITGFAGFSEGSIKNKYGELEPVVIKIRRPQFSSPLCLGLYAITGERPLQTEGAGSPFIFSLVGFRRAQMDLKKDLVSLYLHAKGK
jgi:hypothetical protein